MRSGTRTSFGVRYRPAADIDDLTIELRFAAKRRGPEKSKCMPHPVRQAKMVKRKSVS